MPLPKSAKRALGPEPSKRGWMREFRLALNALTTRRKLDQNRRPGQTRRTRQEDLQA